MSAQNESVSDAIIAVMPKVRKLGPDESLYYPIGLLQLSSEAELQVVHDFILNEGFSVRFADRRAGFLGTGLLVVTNSGESP